MLSLTITGVALLALLFLYKYIIVPAFLSPLAKIPNAHFSAPVSSLWMSSKRRTGAGTRAIYALHEKHGPAVRLGPNEISVCTPAALKTIYIGGFKKARWYLDAFVNFGRTNIVSMLEHKPHSIQKRMVSNVYSKSFLQTSEDLQTVSERLMFDRFLPIMHSVADKGFEMDILDFAQAVGMDMTSAYLFGYTNGSDFMNNIDYRRYWIKEYATFKDQLPAERFNGEVEKFCFSMCEAADNFMHSEKAKENPLATQPVVYGRLAQSLTDASPSKPDSKQIMVNAASEMLDHLIAGHETSGITMTYLMHEMSKQPALQDRLRNELRTLKPSMVYSDNDPTKNDEGNQRLPSPRALDALPLLDIILQETLRLYAAAPAQQPRVTPDVPNGTTIEGYSNIPGGVRISANAYTLHRNSTVFPEPLKWIPDRWISNNREEMKRWFWPFGSGGRMCLGSNFAIQSM